MQKVEEDFKQIKSYNVKKEDSDTWKVFSDIYESLFIEHETIWTWLRTLNWLIEWGWLVKGRVMRIVAMTGTWKSKLAYFFAKNALFNKKKVLLTLIIGLLYAISDEIHQGFVPDRMMDIMDVLVDSLGILFGVLIIKWKSRKK